MITRRIAWFAVLALVCGGCRRSEPQVRPDDEASGPKRVKCTIPAGEVVEGTVSVPARCDLEIAKTLRVPAGASLEIGAGARLAFAKGAGLVVEGGALRARGSEKEPVVFTSAEAAHAPGDWTGIVFARRPAELVPDLAAMKAEAGVDAAVPPHAESILEHVIVEYGGAKLDTDPAFERTAGVYVSPFAGDTVSLSHVRVSHNAGAGLHVGSARDVTKLEKIGFGPNEGTSARVPIELVESVAAEDPGESVHVTGVLTRSLVLPKLARPYVIDATLSVRAGKSAVTLEIASGAVIQVVKGGSVSLTGSGATAKLVAHGVTFTSAETSPAPGDWRGIDMIGDVAADLDAVVIEHAGSASKGGHAAVRLPSDEKKVKLVGSTFRNNAGAAIETWNECKPWELPALKNTSVGKPLCEVNALLMKMPSLSMLGSLGSLSGSALALGKPSGLGELGGLEPVYIGGLGAGGAGFGGGGISTIGSGGGAIGGGGAVATKVSSSSVVETSITASGGLPVEVVRRIVRTRTSSLRTCHAGSDASGTITVSFTIDGAGKVTSASATGGTLGDASIRACVSSVLRSTVFPAAKAGDTTTATATHRYSAD